MIIFNIYNIVEEVIWLYYINVLESNMSIYSKNYKDVYKF